VRPVESGSPQRTVDRRLHALPHDAGTTTGVLGAGRARHPNDGGSSQAARRRSLTPGNQGMIPPVAGDRRAPRPRFSVRCRISRRADRGSPQRTGRQVTAGAATRRHRHDPNLGRQAGGGVPQCRYIISGGAPAFAIAFKWDADCIPSHRRQLPRRVCISTRHMKTSSEPRGDSCPHGNGRFEPLHALLLTHDLRSIHK